MGESACHARAAGTLRQPGATAGSEKAIAESPGESPGAKDASSPDRYVAALRYLYGLTDWEQRPMDRATRARLLLARPAALLARLGHPERRYRTILVAGTKGKGSTAAMLAAVLRAAGYRTGFYSQPHLHTYRERIRVDDILIAEGEVAAGVARIRPHVEALERERPDLDTCTTYEVSTALAFDHFARAGAQVAVVEVGLGGRLDATNLVPADLAVLTSISYDHTAILGHTLAEIAGEKAGIIKEGRPVLVAPQAPEALTVLERVAAARGAPLAIGGRDWTWRGAHVALTVECLRAVPGVWRAPWRLDGVRVALRGAHQLENAAIAVAAAQALEQASQRDDGQSGEDGSAVAAPRARLTLPPAAIEHGLASVAWPARCELVRPSGQGCAPVLIDGAHNGDSATKLAAALRYQVHDELRWERLWLVVGVGQDKDLPAIVAPLAPLASGAWAVAARHPRSRDAADVVAAVRTAGVPVQPAPTVMDGVRAAQRRAGPRDLVCVTGSLFVAAEAREALGLVPPEAHDPAHG